MTTMTFIHPMVITSRLLPGLRVADASISVEPISVIDGHVQWSVFIDRVDATSYEGIGELGTGMQHAADGNGAQAALAAVLSFLMADADSYTSTMDADSSPADGWLFSGEIAEWAYLNNDDIYMAAEELSPEEYA